MAQDELNKEDKFDFTAEGEAKDFVTLDQARLIAMQTARDQPGNYGARLRGESMVFEAADESETDDDYVLTLAFRPEGKFSGTPGREQFIFRDKLGQVAFR